MSGSQKQYLNIESFALSMKRTPLEKLPVTFKELLSTVFKACRILTKKMKENILCKWSISRFN